MLVLLCAAPLVMSLSLKWLGCEPSELLSLSSQWWQLCDGDLSLAAELRHLPGKITADAILSVY